MRQTIISLAYVVLLTIAAAAPSAGAPRVAIKNGTIVGSRNSSVDVFQGIPFAQPPTKSLRLKPPRTLAKPFGTITATSTPLGCPQFNAQTTNTSHVNSTGYSEDCLTLNVVRPSSANDKSKLPVALWIYGGAYAAGSTAGSPGNYIVNQSLALGHDIIFVAGNYRVGGFGFLGGKELSEEGSTNLGLRDQRAVMEWVAENIAAFGGDPDRVTIFGESAGALSVYNQLLVNDGDTTYKGKPLFHAAIMDSGTAIQGTDVKSPLPQHWYDSVVSAAGCASAADSLACLRALPFNQFQNAVDSVPSTTSYAGLSLVYKPRPDNSSRFFSNGPRIADQTKIVNIPVIIGDQEDEGTIFNIGAQSNVTTTAALTDYYQTVFYPHAPPEVIAGLVNTYPTDPAAGSPFRTGSNNEVYPQFKRNSALFGDVTFTLVRRSTLNTFRTLFPKTPVYTYLSTYDHALNNTIGTYHSSDIAYLFGGAQYEVPRVSVPTYYISFFHYHDPNRISTAAPLIEWPQWTNESLAMLNFSRTENSVIRDDFRWENYKYIVDNADALVQ